MYIIIFRRFHITMHFLFTLYIYTILEKLKLCDGGYMEKKELGISRRDFLKGTAASVAAMSILNATSVLADDSVETTVVNRVPKYVFLFIGDGMSYPQIQASSYYLGAVSQNAVISEDLEFMKFPVNGSQESFDSTSFCPDSASTATSIATGYKTKSGTINRDEKGTKSYVTIAEKLKQQKNYKIGVISSVNLNHATPAAFYAHQDSRSSYYEIGEELVKSGFDYFAGGALLAPTGKNGDKTDLYTVAKKAGYKVAKTYSATKALTKNSGKVIAIAEKLADGNAMSYEMDASTNEMLLCDYVEQAINLLDNENGFFLMVEGGKIDWACHVNDCAATIHDTIALDNSVKKAVEFYEKHPDETLILVTGDHETGGLTIGYAGTNYNTFLTNIQHQKISYARFDSDYVTKYKKNHTSFDTVLKDVKEKFGLMLSTDADASLYPTLVLTDEEYEDLQEAYKKTLLDDVIAETMTQAAYVHYGTYEPLTVTITHILNHKSGIDYATYAHSGLTVPVYAKGCGSSEFDGHYDNTDIYKKMAKLTGVK